MQLMGKKTRKIYICKEGREVFFFTSLRDDTTEFNQKS